MPRIRITEMGKDKAKIDKAKSTLNVFLFSGKCSSFEAMLEICAKGQKLQALRLNTKRNNISALVLISIIAIKEPTINSVIAARNIKRENILTKDCLF